MEKNISVQNLCPVTDGAVITVKCGDPSWPSASNNNGEAQVYTVTVKQEKAPSINVSIRSQMEGGYLHSLEQVRFPPTLRKHTVYR